MSKYRDYRKSDEELIRLIKHQGRLPFGYGGRRMFYIENNIEFLIKADDYVRKDSFMDGGSFVQGFSILKNVVTLLKILNYNQNKFNITGINDILLIRMIYMDLFDIIDESMKSLAIPEKYLNYWLMRKLGKKEYIGRIRGSWTLRDTRKKNKKI